MEIQYKVYENMKLIINLNKYIYIKIFLSSTEMYKVISSQI